jgi:hypothetical protein
MLTEGSKASANHLQPPSMISWKKERILCFEDHQVFMESSKHMDFAHFQPIEFRTFDFHREHFLSNLRPLSSFAKPNPYYISETQGKPTKELQKNSSIE